MNVSFHTDSDGELHISAHNVREVEVIEALSRPLEIVAGRDDSYTAIGRTRAGRLLKIIYTDAVDKDGIFVITAFDLPRKQEKALKRRLKRKNRL
ncbi:MAG: hypothetical protein H7144_14085 [Burkholderiales bacterium]|nr:hypothetical protein [Phycisphaerae bacterium]